MNHQAKRWDLAQVESDLSRLQEILRFPNRLPSAELVAEELLARAYDPKRCIWLDDQFTAQIELASGLIVATRGNEASNDVGVRFDWSSRGLRWTRNDSKSLNEAMSSACNVLKAEGWRVQNRSTSGQTAYLNATIDVEAVAKNFRRAASTIAKAAQYLAPQ